MRRPRPRRNPLFEIAVLSLLAAVSLFGCLVEAVDLVVTAGPGHEFSAVVIAVPTGRGAGADHGSGASSRW